jgi:hypothetical protein
MANTTFTGPVRSENGFKTIVKNETTGAITEIATLGTAPVALDDGDVTLTNATHSGRTLVVPRRYAGQHLHTALTPVAGSCFSFVYGRRRSTMRPTSSSTPAQMQTSSSAA